MSGEIKSVSLVELRDQLDNYVQDGNVEELREKADEVLMSDKIVASSNDFYNFAISLANLNDFAKACAMFERGLREYPSAVDLLAGYISYGVECGVGYRENCEDYYKKLLSIPDEMWTWRGYFFALQYLNTLKEMVNNSAEEKYIELDDEMQRIIKLFREKSPENERIYIAEARLYKTSDPRREFNILEQAVNTLSVCPRCAYRYAVLVLDRAEEQSDYTKAISALDKALKSTTDSDTNYKNIYFLKGLCLKELYGIDELRIDKKKTTEIYDYFKLAEMDTDDNVELLSDYKKILLQQCTILSRLTKVSFYSYEDEEGS